MKPEDPFAKQEASFQPTCTAEVCKNKCWVIIQNKHETIVKLPFTHEINLHVSASLRENELFVSQVSGQCNSNL